MSASDAHGVVCAQISAVTTEMRLEVRLGAASYRALPAAVAGLLRSFRAARQALLADDGPTLAYLDPFLETIRCEETSGRVTQRALSAVLAMLRADLLTTAHESEAAIAISSIVRAATYCRFEVTDPAADEVVLKCILDLLLGCVQCRTGALLSDESVCELVHSCFRIASQAHRHAARATAMSSWAPAPRALPPRAAAPRSRHRAIPSSSR